MILVDTSVFIDYLKGIESNPAIILDNIIQNKISYGINDFIYQEVLQGSKTNKEFEMLKEYFESLPFYYLQLGRDSYERAALMNFQCRRNGVTVRSTIDLLIAETAIENSLYILHNDSDFDNIAKIIPELRIYQEI